jgi:hypothetical protein
MKKMFYLAANGMAAFMDAAVGSLIAVLIALLLGHPLSWWEPFAIGAIFGLLPDFDILVPIIWTGITGHKLKHQHHESVMHWPLVVLPAATVVVWYFFGEYWGVAAFFCIAMHYIHDMVMMGYDGPGWFVRLHRTYWARRGAVEPADSDHKHWIAVNWLRPSLLSVREIAIGDIALSMSIALVTGNPVLGITAYLVLLICACIFWWLVALNT